MNGVSKLLRDEKKLFKFNKVRFNHIVDRGDAACTGFRIETFQKMIRLKDSKLFYNSSLTEGKRAKKERAGLPGRYK